ncbi:hypothetical protein AtEden1_Chr3g0197481 [Arabidopsis thaliana]
MTFFNSFSSHSHRFLMSSVAFLDLRPPPAPPPESSSPLTPPEPPDPPDPQICLSFNVSLTQSPSTTRNPLLPAKPRNSFGVLLLDESLFANWFGEMFPQFNRPAARNLLVFENRSITEANTLSKALYVTKLTCQALKRGIPTTLPLIEAAPLSLPCIEVLSTSIPRSEAPQSLPCIEVLSLVLPQCEDITCFTDAA